MIAIICNILLKFAFILLAIAIIRQVTANIPHTEPKTTAKLSLQEIYNSLWGNKKRALLGFFRWLAPPTAWLPV